MFFFFNENDEIVLSCIYKDDVLASSLIFYSGIDTAFVRYPPKNNIETFVLYQNKEKILGTFKQGTDGASEIELLGKYLQLAKDSFRIEEDTTLQNSFETINAIKYWLKKEIKPIYMFGNVILREDLFVRFHTSDYIFGMAINANVTINASGVVEKVDFPRDKNSLSINEENELKNIFLSIQRWQPYFLGNKTQTSIKPIAWNSRIQY